MAQRPRSIVLLDGHSLAYRAYHALPDTLRTATGQLTNAVYGFTSMLLRLLEDRQPDIVAVAFDKGRDVERTAAFPAYKANRDSPPEEFRPQVDLIRQVLDVLGVPVVEVAGIEADDVLATLARRAVASGDRVAIVTGDRDAMQLVDDDLTVLYTRRGISEIDEMTPRAVEDRYGVPPERYVDLAALRGDSSDNLPGVPGVGDKTAAKLLRQFGDIDAVYDRLDEVAGAKVPAALAEHEEQVRMNRRLMRLRDDVDLDARASDLERRPTDPDAVRTLFATLEFHSLLDRLGALLDPTGPADGSTVRTPRRLSGDELAAWLRDAPGRLAVVPAVDGRPPHVSLTALGIAAADRDPCTLVVEDMTGDDRATLVALLTDPDIEKLTHDRKLLDHVAVAVGAQVAAVVLDTQLAAYLLHPQQRQFDLEQLAPQHLSRPLAPAAGHAAQDQLALALPDDEAWGIHAQRAQAVLELGEIFERELEERDQTPLLRDIELPLAPVLARMERAGIAVDLPVLAEIRDRLASRVDELEREIHDHAGRTFNVGSGPQLQQVLFEDLDLPRTRRIKTGYSTDATALAGLRDQHPIIEAIIEWRELTKLISTYLDALPPLVDPDTGRIHTTLSQTIAATGRLASSRPNLQNIPVRRQEGREIRRAFVAGAGYAGLLVADYSQIELRILAHLSQDRGLLEAFAAGEDIHATTAAKVFDLPLEQVDGGLRDRAKAVNYGLAYGLTAYGLGQQLGIPPDEAQEIVDAYVERFPGVGAYLEETVAEATRSGYTSTLFGRRRYLPDLRSGDRNRRQMAERMALNAPIQGTAADVIKLAMVHLQEALDDSRARSRLLLQVHDEVILEVAEEEHDTIRQLVVDTLAHVVDLAVPLEVDTAFGVNWYDAQKH